MSRKFVIHDTLEAFVKEGDSEKFFGLTTAGNITKSVSQEELKAGIHNKTFYVLSVDEGIKFSVSLGLHYQDVYEIQTGQKFEEKADVKIHKIVEAEDGTITATEDTAQAGQILDFKAGSFPKISHVQLRTIAYDVETAEIAADIYYIFPKSQSDGNLYEEFWAGAKKTTEINFTALVSGDSYGQMIIIPRTPVIP